MISVGVTSFLVAVSAAALRLRKLLYFLGSFYQDFATRVRFKDTAVDKSAFLENEEAVTAALSANTYVQIDISSVRAGTLFGEWCQSSNYKLRIEMHTIP